MSEHSGRRCATRSVKPRAGKINADRPIVAVRLSTDEYVTEDGEYGTIEDLAVRLPELRASVFICTGSGELLSILSDSYGDNGRWQYSVAPGFREHWRPHLAAAGRRVYTNLTIVNWFGFQGERKQANRYHIALDPLVFSDAPTEVRPSTLPELLQWGKGIRAFCIQENVNIRPTQGAIARQFLTDPRFYPNDRRKVPRATNDRAREYIGGNHYEVRGRDDTYTGHYVDQSSAHHHAARNTDLPSSNSLYAYGHFRLPGEAAPWKVDPERVYEFLGVFKGLVCGHIGWDRRGGQYVPEWMQEWRPTKIGDKPGPPTYFYTCELDLMRSLGVTVTSIVAAWGATTADEGLPAYARHAGELVAAGGAYWLKPLLLAAYGCLATRPKEHSVGFHHSKGGKATDIPVGKRTLTVSLNEASKELEPSTNNVIQRGMIEAATRAESLMYANYLQSEGFRVLCIYVDAVIVEEDDREIPIFPPWRHKKPLTGLRFISRNAFTSMEMTKLPGHPDRAAILAASLGERLPRERIGNRARQDERLVNHWLDLQTAR